MQCDPVRRSDGKCIVNVKMATALVQDVGGRKYVVLRRRLRLNKQEAKVGTAKALGTPEHYEEYKQNCRDAGMIPESWELWCLTYPLPAKVESAGDVRYISMAEAAKRQMEIHERLKAETNDGLKANASDVDDTTELQTEIERLKSELETAKLIEKDYEAMTDNLQALIARFNIPGNGSENIDECIARYVLELHNDNGIMRLKLGMMS